MQAWLAEFLTKWVWGLFSKGVKAIKDWWDTRQSYIKIGEDNQKMAESVESISEEIKKLIKAGQPVPQELKDKLREEARKLVAPIDTTK